MASFSHYYGEAKGRLGIAKINPKDMEQLGEDWLITAAAGAGMAAVGAMFGGLDKKILGFQVPLDGLGAGACGLVGLTTRSRGMQIASIALGGSAAVRTFGKIFSKGLGAHGEIDDWASGGYSGMFGFGGAGAAGALPQFANYGYGWGQDAHDPLVEAAKRL
jgi:hypothetical protein